MKCYVDSSSSRLCVQAPKSSVHNYQLRTRTFLHQHCWFISRACLVACSQPRVLVRCRNPAISPSEQVTTNAFISRFYVQLQLSETFLLYVSMLLNSITKCSPQNFLCPMVALLVLFNYSCRFLSFFLYIPVPLIPAALLRADW